MASTASHHAHSRARTKRIVREDIPHERGYNPLKLLYVVLQVGECLLDMIPRPRSFRVTYADTGHFKHTKYFRAWTRMGARAEARRLSGYGAKDVQIYLKI